MTVERCPSCNKLANQFRQTYESYVCLTCFYGDEYLEYEHREQVRRKQSGKKKLCNGCFQSFRRNEGMHYDAFGINGFYCLDCVEKGMPHSGKRDEKFIAQVCQIEFTEIESEL